MTISEKPMMALSGVRSSWLIIARKSDLARLAPSASSFARFSSVSARMRSVTSKKMPSR